MMKWTPPVSPHGLVGHTEPCEFQSREHERSPSHACYDRRDRFGKRGFRAGFRRPGGAHPGAQATDPEGLFPGNGEPGAADGGDGGLRQRALLGPPLPGTGRSEEHTSELQSRENLVCRLLLEKKKKVGYSLT